jgi:hypothetical protein
MQVLKPVRLVDEIVSFRPAVQNNNPVITIEAVVQPLINPIIDTRVAKTVATKDEVFMRPEMLPERGK